MNQTNNKILTVIVALHCAFILGASLVYENRRESGRTVLLETVPVDPRDLLRGDYVILGYKMSRIEPWQFERMPENGFQGGETVYVLLEERGKYFELVRAFTSKPELQGAGQVILKGRATSGARGTISVAYGLERYYVKEGTGNPRGKVTVLASISPSGDALIKEVFVDDVPYREAAQADIAR